MTESQTPAQAAKHTAINLGWYAIICVVLAVAYVTYDTHFFSKPLSWTVVRENLGYDSPSK